MTRRLVALLLMLCLPLQLQAAMLMPMGQPAAAVAAAEPQAMSHCQHVADERGAPADHSGSCDRCVLCHLVGPTPLVAILPALPVARDFAPPVELTHFSHIPEAPQRPPRRA